LHDRLTRTHRALITGPAEGLVESLADEMAKVYGTAEVELLQVDYRLSELIPLRGGPAISKPGSAAWRCFDHQVEVVDEGVGYLPVTARGERAGVLRLAPLPADPELRAELPEVATLLAHELAAVRAGTDRYAMAARTRRLTLAAEMQWELLPGRSRIRPAFSLAGQLEPAYAVRGDSFDWADDGDRLWLSVMNGRGEGVAASTLTCLATNALRNARRAGLPLADQAALADQAVYGYYRGSEHVAALLLDLDLSSGALTAVDAGSPWLLLVRGGEVTALEPDHQFPLGMFEGTIYRAQRFQLERDDRLLVVSDGVYDAASEAGTYGEIGLRRTARRTRTLEPLEAVRALLGELRAFAGTDLADDAAAVCVDWLGPDSRRGQ
jgi:serine phosphatase RsbU (regulator of sigma subunit)